MPCYLDTQSNVRLINNKNTRTWGAVNKLMNQCRGAPDQTRRLLSSSTISLLIFIIFYNFYNYYCSFDQLQEKIRF